MENLIAWRVDEEHNLYSPAGTWVGKLTPTIIWLYDRRMKINIPFTRDDWARLIQDPPRLSEKLPDNQ